MELYVIAIFAVIIALFFIKHFVSCLFRIVVMLILLAILIALYFYSAG